jgi:hypothetical protein
MAQASEQKSRIRPATVDDGGAVAAVGRPFRRADLSRCLDVQPACLGDGIVGRQTALRVWNDLMDQPCFHGTAIESERPCAGDTIVGCGMGAFVSSAFVDREIADPWPGLNARIVAAIAAGEPVLLSRDAVDAGNAGRGLDFVNLYGTWRDGILDPDRLAEGIRTISTLLPRRRTAKVNRRPVMRQTPPLAPRATAATRHTASRSTARITRAGDAPTAMRRPIARTCCATKNAMVP